MKLNLFKKNNADLPVYPLENLDDSTEDDGTIVQNVEELSEKVVGHRIVSAEMTTQTKTYFWGDVVDDVFVLTLENGHRVVLKDTDDCCAHTTLNDFLLHPESVNHVILGVGTTDKYQTWHIYADFGDIVALDVGWDCGNPFYYGYGFDIDVIDYIDVDVVEPNMSILPTPTI